MMTTRIMRLLTGLTLFAMVVTGCGTRTGAAVGAGSGAAIGAGTGHTKKGALIGTGVDAAAGVLYDAPHEAEPLLLHCLCVIPGHCGSVCARGSAHI
jgi:hypothetical protein